MRTLIVATLLAFCACGPASQAGVPEYGYDVVHVYPHDRAAFTEGLFYLDGFLYEGCGPDDATRIRKVKLETGEVLQEHVIPNYFGEGIIKWKDKLFQMTWKTEVGFIYDFKTFQQIGQFHYPGEGWSMTTDGKVIYMDDGTPQIRIWDPESLKDGGQPVEKGRITVTDDGKPLENINEMEWVKGEIYANIWQTDKIARIDPKTGKVVGWIDLTGLLSPSDRSNAPGAETDVLNGIAYDAEHDRLFVTGKRWPKLFEIKLVKKGSR
jgi:glutaminyl-peptide cyclotransferase